MISYNKIDELSLTYRDNTQSYDIFSFQQKLNTEIGNEINDSWHIDFIELIIYLTLSFLSYSRRILLLQIFQHSEK